MAFTREQCKAADAQLAKKQEELYRVRRHLSGAEHTLFLVAGARTVYRGRSSFQSFDGSTRADINDAVERAENLIASDNGAGYRRDEIKKAIDRYDEFRDRVDALDAQIMEAHNEWSVNGKWSRFFAVQGGHIHSSTTCSSLRPTTEIAWLPELADETEQEAVEAYGSVICTKCFPSAPVEWTTGRVKTKDQVDREARAAERVAKRAEADAKRIIDPATGTDLLDSDGRALKTERAATNHIVMCMKDLANYGDNHPGSQSWHDYIDRATVAVAAKKLTADGGVVSEAAVQNETSNIRAAYAKKSKWHDPKAPIPTTQEGAQVTDKIACIQSRISDIPDTLLRFGFREGEPVVVEKFDWDSAKWGRSMSTLAGSGKILAGVVRSTPVDARTIPEQTASSYGHATGSCLMCGKPLSDKSSLSRGYGPGCAGKVR